MTKLSLADLELNEAGVPVEMIDDDGSATGILIEVLASNLDSVNARQNALEDERRRKAAVRAAKAAKSRQEDAGESAEETAEYVRRAAAVRVSGWNLADEFTEANVVKLFKLRPKFALQVLDASNETSRFTKGSPKAS
jgi:hypothetical protein